ncbi:MAG: phosphopantetheine-binding protein [Polyangiaceae bacterium]
MAIRPPRPMFYLGWAWSRRVDVIPRGEHLEPYMELPRLIEELKTLLVSELNLTGHTAASIDDDAALFGEGLGLDSLDALQIAMLVEEHFGVRVPDGDEARPLFRSVRTLAEFVARERAAQEPSGAGAP